MSDVPAERIALHVVRHLVRGLVKAESQGDSIQSLRHWWTLSLGQRSEDLERGLEYAVARLWIERAPDNLIMVTSRGSDYGLRAEKMRAVFLPDLTDTGEEVAECSGPDAALVQGARCRWGGASRAGFGCGMGMSLASFLRFWAVAARWSS
jgi:hypothetical protein